MKIVLDTNILLDALMLRQPFCDSACKLLDLIAAEEIEGCISANSITDIYYIAKKYLKTEELRKAIEGLLAVFSIIDVTGDDCRKALELDIADFEDALLMVCAYNIKANYIVSRDTEFLKLKSMVEVISAQDFLGGRE